MAPRKPLPAQKSAAKKPTPPKPAEKTLLAKKPLAKKPAPPKPAPPKSVGKKLLTKQVALPKPLPGGAAEYPSYYAIIRKIPRGRVLTYGDVAGLAGRPTSARRVGYALAALKDPAVPWWRVVNARGEVSPRSGDLLGACELDQRARLLKEGVYLDGEGRLELSQYRWAGDGRRKVGLM